MSQLAPGSLEVRVGTVEASKRAGDVCTPTRPPRGARRGLRHQGWGGGVPPLPSALRPQHNTLVWEMGRKEASGPQNWSEELVSSAWGAFPLLEGSQQDRLFTEHSAGVGDPSPHPGPAPAGGVISTPMPDLPGSALYPPTPPHES